MSAPYSTQSISGYNSNPPADDGSSSASNQILWATVKTKIGDPVKTLSEAIDSALVSAFPKVIGGGGVTSTAVNYTVQSSDQGKLVRATASSITITTPDAATVTSPFVFALLNNSSGTITLDGNGAQTVDGSSTLTIPAGGGCILFTDSSNWFTNGVQGTLVGKQLQAGDIINATISHTASSNAATFSLNTLAGAAPSSSDPVLICFPNPSTGGYVYRTVAASTTLTLSSGSTLGASNNVALRIWLVLFDDGGTVRMGAINCRSGTTIYPLGRSPTASSTAEGGAGAADSAQTFYTGTAVTSKNYVILGYAEYNSGLATAGTYNVNPDTIRIFTRGSPLPGSVLQVQENYDGATANGNTALPYDDTIPQNTEGTQFMTQAITPTSTANILRIAHSGAYGSGATVTTTGIALFQDTTANALAVVGATTSGDAAAQQQTALNYSMVAGTTSATTFKIRAGNNGGSTITFNGTASARKWGGVMSSVLRVEEVVA